MKFVIVSNVLEHPQFPSFVRSIARTHPDAAIVSAGGFLHVFPLRGDDRGSLAEEVFGDSPHGSPCPLRQMLLPIGREARVAQMLARSRLLRMFDRIEDSLRSQQLYLLPSEADYPFLIHEFCAHSRRIRSLDGYLVEHRGVPIAAVGANRPSAHPFRSISEICSKTRPGDDADDLERIRGAQILFSSTSRALPNSPAWRNFLRTSSVKLIICGSPIQSTSNQNSERDELERTDRGSESPVPTSIEGVPVAIAPSFEEREALIVEVTAGSMQTLDVIDISATLRSDPPSQKNVAAQLTA